jgi:hypothetical protein
MDTAMLTMYVVGAVFVALFLAAVVSAADNPST